MKPQTVPSKEQIREFMAARQQATTPPKTPEEIRRELGWGMLANNKIYVR